MSPRRYDLFTLLLLFLAVVVCYGQTFDVPWYLDDYAVIHENPVIAHPFAALFARRGLSLFTLALNYRWGGLNPFGYHLFNLALHFCAGGLVYLLGKRFFSGRERWLPGASALLFIVHPLQTEAVTYITQRMTSLAGCLVLLACYLFIRAREIELNGAPLPPRQHLWPYGTALLSGILALAAKENSAVLPLLLYLCDRALFANHRSRRSSITAILPFTVAPLCAGFILVALPLTGGASVHDLTAVFSPDAASPGRYLATQFQVIWVYLRLCLWPVGQALDHAYPLARSFWNPATLLGLGSLMLLATALWHKRHRFPLLAFGGAWFISAQLIESSVIPLDPLFEHRLYLPLFGLCIALVDCIAQRPPSPLVRALVAGILLFNVVLCWQRNQLWRDPIAFFQDNLHRAPLSGIAAGSLAYHYRVSGRTTDAEQLWIRLMNEQPDIDSTYPNLAAIYRERGDLEGARGVLENGRRYYPDDPVTLTLLCEILLELQRPAAALPLAMHLQTLVPDDRQARDLLATVRSRLATAPPVR